MAERVHLLEGVLADDDLVHVLLDAVEEELVLLLLDARNGQLAEDLVDGLELAQLAQLAVGTAHHLLHQLVLRRQRLPVLLLYHQYNHSTTTSRHQSRQTNHQ